MKHVKSYVFTVGKLPPRTSVETKLFSSLVLTGHSMYKQASGLIPRKVRSVLPFTQAMVDFRRDGEVAMK